MSSIHSLPLSDDNEDVSYVFMPTSSYRPPLKRFTPDEYKKSVGLSEGGGYPLHIFTDDTQERIQASCLTCAICSEVPYDAITHLSSIEEENLVSSSSPSPSVAHTSRCQAIFCRGCLTTWMDKCVESNNRSGICCPACRRFITLDRLISSPLEPEINLFPIHCLHVKEGCAHVTSLSNIVSHINNECSFRPVPCRWNQHHHRQLEPFQLQHEQKECTSRSVQCIHCDNTFPYDKVEDHENDHCTRMRSCANFCYPFFADAMSASIPSSSSSPSPSFSSSSSSSSSSTSLSSPHSSTIYRLPLHKLFELILNCEKENKLVPFIVGCKKNVNSSPFNRKCMDTFGVDLSQFYSSHYFPRLPLDEQSDDSMDDECMIVGKDKQRREEKEIYNKVLFVGVTMSPYQILFSASKQALKRELEEGYVMKAAEIFAIHQMVANNEMHAHLIRDCPLEVMSCSFKEIGCKTSHPKCLYPIHNQCDSVSHSSGFHKTDMTQLKKSVRVSTKQKRKSNGAEFEIRRRKSSNWTTRSRTKINQEETEMLAETTGTSSDWEEPQPDSIMYSNSLFYSPNRSIPFSSSSSSSEYILIDSNDDDYVNNNNNINI